MKNEKKKSWLIPTVITTLAVVLVGTFVLSGTLAKFITTVSGSVTDVPAAQFAFNKNLNDLSDITWTITDFGVSSDDKSNGKVFYPGATGKMKFDVSLVSDVKVTSSAEVALTDGTGALNKDYEVTNALFGADPVVLRDQLPVKFYILTTDKGADLTSDANAALLEAAKATSFGISEISTKLDAALEAVLANYNTNSLGDLVEKDVYLFWDWAYEVEDDTATADVNEAEKADAIDTLFGNYVAMFEKDDPTTTDNDNDGVQSKLGLTVTMTVEQVAP